MFCDLNAYEGDNFKSIENETVEIFKQNIKRDTEDKIQRTYNTILKYGANDIFRFGRRLLQNNKTAYDLCKGDWQGNLKNSKLNINVEVIIRRIGEESYHE
jgi:hypothetical protein